MRDRAPLLGGIFLVAVGMAVETGHPLLGAVLILAGGIWLIRESLAWGAAVYIVTAPFPWQILFHHHRIAVSDVVAIILGLWLFWRHRKRLFAGTSWGTLWIPAYYRAPLLLLLGLAVLSLGVSLSRTTTVIKILEYLEFFVVMPAVLRALGAERQPWQVVLWALFGVAGVLALDGVYQFLFQLGPIANVVDVHHVRADATFGQPNAFGGFEADTFPLILAWIAAGPSAWRKNVWAWVALTAVALGVISSFSRGAWVADAGAVFFMGVAWILTRGWSGIGRRVVIPGILIPVAAFLAIDLLGKTNLSHSAVSLSYQSTLERLTSSVTAVFNPNGHYDTHQRLLIWQTAIRAIMHHPVLGVGLGGFQRYITLHRPPGLAAIPPMAHDLYLEWGADLGVLGILAGIWLEWRWIRTLIQGVRRLPTAGTEWRWALAWGGFGTAVAFIVQNWVDFLIDHGVIVPLIMALAIGWLVSESWREDRG